MLRILEKFAVVDEQVNSNLNKLNLSNNNDLISTVGTIINTLSGLIGIVAVIMLIIGGFRYATAGANEKNVTAARNQIMYAIIGIVIVLLAWGITQFVLGAFATPTPKATK